MYFLESIDKRNCVSFSFYIPRGWWRCSVSKRISHYAFLWLLTWRSIIGGGYYSQSDLTLNSLDHLGRGSQINALWLWGHSGADLVGRDITCELAYRLFDCLSFTVPHLTRLISATCSIIMMEMQSSLYEKCRIANRDIKSDNLT